MSVATFLREVYPRWRYSSPYPLREELHRLRPPNPDFNPISPVDCDLPLSPEEVRQLLFWRSRQLEGS